MKAKRIFLIFSIMAALAIGALFIYSGFLKRTDVVLTGYSVSEDGSAVTVDIGLATSMGYTRGINAEYDGDAIYCSFYRAFGGAYIGIGSKDRFRIKLKDTSAKIYFDYGEAGYVLVLQKDEAANTWIQAPRK